jgi:hypothetical protein
LIGRNKTYLSFASRYFRPHPSLYCLEYFQGFDEWKKYEKYDREVDPDQDDEPNESAPASFLALICELPTVHGKSLFSIKVLFFLFISKLLYQSCCQVRFLCFILRLVCHHASSPRVPKDSLNLIKQQPGIDLYQIFAV